MKRSISIILSALCCLSGCTGLSAGAECRYDTETRVMCVQTDTFTYRSYDAERDLSCNTNVLETALIDLSFDFEQDERVVVVTAPKTGRVLNHWSNDDVLLKDLPEDVRAGDLLRVKVEGMYEDFYSYADCKDAVKIGSGQALLGDEFETVVQYLMYDAYSEGQRYSDTKDEPFWGTFTVHYGDLNWDGAVDIMDAVYLNKYLLGGCQFKDYTKIAADTNGDGVLDTTDSLNLLK